jgi:hypothetical protein
LGELLAVAYFKKEGSNMRNIVLLGLASMLAACVTINIYFPAAAADKAADQIIDDVWQLKNGQNKDAPAKDATQPAEPAAAPEVK